MQTRPLLLLVLLAAAACSGATTQPPAETGPFRSADLSLTTAVDKNPDAKVVEIDLEAKPGRIEYVPGHPTDAWTFGGTIPGPLIEAHVGDRLVVHFKNALPEGTTIHWHGVRTPASMDGTMMMQSEIPPGGTFTYDFTLPEAGLYWYHPHMRTDVQVEKGLYGAILVRGADAVEAPERVLVLDDVLVDDRGNLPASTANDEMLGREGNVPLVNGHVTPATSVRSGSWERWRLVNAANARYFDLTLAGADLVQLGTDGGWLTQPRRASSIFLTPGERADVLVHFTGAPGSRSRLTSKAYTRGHGITSPALEVLELRYASDPAVAQADPTPAQLATIAPLEPDGTVRALKLEEQMDMSGGGMKTTFLINGESFPNVTPIEAKVDSTEVWEVDNQTEMDHPFHIHGFFFQPLTLDGAPLPLEWKDTLNVPAKKTLRLAIRYAEHTGKFPFHCHILEHAELGMVGELEVVP